MTQPSIKGVGHGMPRMLYASDGSNWYAILVDSDGHVKIDIVAYPGSNALGNFPFGYYDRYQEAIDWTLTATSEEKYTSLVPANEIWVIQSAFIRNVTGALTNLGVAACVNSVLTVHLCSGRDIPQWYLVIWNGSLVLKTGDNLCFWVSSGASGESIDGGAWGYKMKVA